MFRRASTLMVLMIVFGMGLTVLAETIVNGEEARLYIGHIVSHNERTSQIVIKTENATGRWRLSRQTALFYGKERLTLPEIFGKNKAIRDLCFKDR